MEVVKALDIPLDGSISYFPLTNGSAIITKQLQQDGTSKITIYEPKVEKSVKYVTMEEIEKRFKEYEEFEEEFEDIKKRTKRN